MIKSGIDLKLFEIHRMVRIYSFISINLINLQNNGALLVIILFRIESII